MLSALGVVVGVGGFAITLVQLRKVKGSSAAAADATERLKRLIAQFDALQECAKAEAELDFIRTNLLDLQKELGLLSVETFALSLVKLRDGAPWLSDSTHGRLEKAIESVDALMQIAGRKKKPESSSTLVRQAGSLREYTGLFMKIRAEAQQEQQA